MTSDPQRLLDDDATDAALRALLRAGRDELPAPAQLERLEARVLGAIGPGGGPGPAPAASGAAKLAIGVASLTGVAAAIAIAVALSTGPSSPPPSFTASAPSLDPAPLDPPLDPRPLQPPTAEGAVEPAPLDAPATPEVAPRPVPPRDTGMDELALLTTAQSSLASSPSRALALSDEHARRFPDGALAQEREVVAITALLRLRRAQAARARAARFRARWPGSAHARRLEVLLAED